jgi:molecular chaperone GrpE
MEEKNKKNNSEEENIEFIADEEGPGQDFQKKFKKVKEELNKCETERKEYLEGWQRAKADLINYKKDEMKRFEEMTRFASEELIKDILPALDSFNLALSHIKSPEAEKGVLLIRSQLEDILKRRGLGIIEAKRGEKFNPAIHESVAEVESEEEEGVIVEEVQKGYSLAGKILRPARVKLSKNKI